MMGTITVTDAPSTARGTRFARVVVASVLLATMLVGVSAGTEAPPEAEALFTAPHLVYSLNADRSDAKPLDGAVIPANSNLHIWLAPTFHATNRVRFDVNDERWRTEWLAPWDLAGTDGLLRPKSVWSSDQRINEGTNEVVARVGRWFFRDRVVTATFERVPNQASTAPGLGLDFTDAEQIIDRYVEGEGLNGAGFVVVHPDHGIVHESYRGEFAPDRISLIASASKMITAGVLLHLADEGRFDMNEPISSIPGLESWGRGIPGVTPAQLLSNSSGLVGLGSATPPFFGYLDIVSGCSMNAWVVLLDCGRAIAENRGDDWSQAPPDTEFRYGGPQWQVAGALAEAVTGQSWAELVDEIYVEPCGLDVLGYTTLFQIEFLVSPDPLPYPGNFDGDLDVLIGTRNPIMEGGGYTTPHDYADLLLMLLRGGQCGGGQVLTPAAIDMMLTDRIGPAYGGTSFGQQGYGLGWTVDGDIRTDPGLFGALPWLDLGGGYGAYFVIENTGGGDGRRELIAAVRAAMAASDLGAGSAG